ncbi:hypothetical protein SVA_3024 [Sulfurifustis variabilis]|uniref:Uncharacterized protein n=2 Tax=Sulfurifustis variabilis TaxID=1675686 RepID=A0A1B4VA54_9GAMM|nr:hypothetical protein SVA_3024 [Sulfurifustis variabilis]
MLSQCAGRMVGLHGACTSFRKREAKDQYWGGTPYRPGRVRDVFILSAGWGLIGAAFLTPVYDITFSNSADDYKRRRRRNQFDDDFVA